jgi:glutamate-5-semialdehyde dehydrogenase
MSDTGSPAEQIQQLAKQAKKAARELAAVSGESKAAALSSMGDALQKARSELARANAADLEDARNAGLPQPMIARLEITDKVFNYMLKRLKEIAALPDPVGRTLEGFIRPNGFRVSKVTVPIGVIGIIYESRPTSSWPMPWPKPLRNTACPITRSRSYGPPTGRTYITCCAWTVTLTC